MAQAAKRLSRKDPSLRRVLQSLGPPPLWKRPASFATLVRIILEQQVSLASAKSTFDKLRAACDGSPNAIRVIRLGNDGLRAIGFSRQKARYTVALAEDVRHRRFLIGSLQYKSDEQAKEMITSRLGLGEWSADVFLLMALMRPDRFPVGDLALIKGMESLDGNEYGNPNKAIERAQAWRPYRSVATRMVWQWYLNQAKR